MVDAGTIIDERYRVISRLGSGGMADVYLAQDQLLGREVAVKLLHQHFAEDHEFVERFRREASSAAGLSHPNIVGIFDRGEWNGTYYIAMEYVAGRSLKELVREQGPLEPAAAIDIVIQILRAARFAHRRGVIHRDLKPHNVILDEEGRARVTDFGIARAGASDMTMTGSIMGTAQYLSPEQAQGYPVSAASDLYSIGVILYELLTGVVPFEGETAVAIAFKQVAAVPRAPSELNRALPPSLDAVVMRALAKDPAERYTGADELIAALQREREALPAYTPAAVASAYDGHHTSQHAPAAAAGALLLAPGGQLVEDYGQPPAEDDRRRRALLWGLAALVLAGLVVLAIVLLQSKHIVTVPSVRGESEQSAGATLRARGLDPAPSLHSSATVPTGLVISQSPSAGRRVERGSRVGIVVSAGPANAPLGDLAGLSASQAIAKLRKAGFKAAVKKQASSTVASGQVIATEPSAGTLVQIGSTVTLILSSGPAPIRVPDLTGGTQSAAEATLTNDELALGTVTQRISSTEQPGTVLSQSPSSGTSVHAGDKVNLVVAQAPKETAVPNVVGQNETAAAGVLGQAGFTPKTTPETVSEQSQVGIVLKQRPAAGANARKGATVTLTVGELGTATTPTTTTTSTTTTPAPAPAPGAAVGGAG
ncbi:MAG TPA: Stk1 family PASTA domain-containing Ser/Thr kinase [Solirubrobacteraceae bacterium]|jgi:serine/threonine-protein kinase